MRAPTSPAVRSARHLTSVFLVRRGQVLLLYRRGSRAIADSWVGIGGHLEPEELTAPTAAALRELHEEVGVAGDQLTNLALRYVAVRDTGTEIRTTYYYTADLAADVRLPTTCPEGDLRWFDLPPTSPTTGRREREAGVAGPDPTTPDVAKPGVMGPEVMGLEMPPTARVVFRHWVRRGRHDKMLRLITVDADGRDSGVVG